jgi:uncharacterized protein (DUF433 family)
MISELINQRGDIIGTRITVYHLLPHFLDPSASEAYLCRLYELTPEQVAAARAYVLNNLDTVLAQHLKIEERIAAGNPVVQQAQRTRDAMLKFKERLVEQEKAEATELVPAKNNRDFPSFREWLAQQDAHSAGAGS